MGYRSETSSPLKKSSFPNGEGPITIGPDAPKELQECLTNPKPFQDALYAKNVPVQKSCLYLHGREKACPPATNAVDATASTASAPSIASTTSAPSIAASIMT